MELIMNNIEIFFNGNKMKYVELAGYFENNIRYTNKIAYFFIDLDLILTKYLAMIDFFSETKEEITEQMTDVFILEFLNMISHYKKFFYEKSHSQSFFYIGIPNIKYKNYKDLISMIDKISKITNIIPKIYIYHYEDDNHNFWLKYNLIKNICLFKQNSKDVPIIFDFGKLRNFELFYKLTKNYHMFRFDNYKLYLYNFNMFKQEYLSNIEDIYINSIISLLPVYEILNYIKINKQVRIDDVILKFIKKYPDENFNTIETQLLVLKLFTSSKKLESKLIKLNSNMNSYVFSNMAKIVMENWKHVIKDNSIYNINETLNLPCNKRINIETLMKY
jgi:hypothetical protein